MTVTSTADITRRPFRPDATTAASALPPSRAFEKALTLAAMGFHEQATKALRDVTAREPRHAPAWKKLAELLRLAGKDEEARAANARAANSDGAWPAAADQRSVEEIDAAEYALRTRMGEIANPPEQLEALCDQLRSHETEVTAMRLLARLRWQGGDLMTARALFDRALDLAPEYEGARADRAQLLQILREDVDAVSDAARLVANAPANAMYRGLHADALRALRDGEAAIRAIDQLVRDEPGQVRTRCVYAQALRIAGRQEESAREFRTCLALQPGMGEAYWGLAELRGDFLTADDIAAMREHLRDKSRDESSRMLLQNALGQALERAGDFAASFTAYEAGAKLAQAIAASKIGPYDPIKDAHQMHRRRAVFTAPLLAKRPVPAACPDSTPIFIVGMPRAGSTLVEQILASHSLVEGTMELPVLGNIVRDLSVSRLLVEPDAYPECVAELSDSELAELGARYTEQAAVYRNTNRPYFIDKRPWNWFESGLIRLILPHAKIVDVRRKPMAACFAIYKHMLAKESVYPYNLHDLAHHYTQYAATMAHYERVMPGHVHFLSYERLVEDMEREIRRLLDYCGLPFEEGCLRFWEADRAVSTPSSEQVRRPIYRDALEQWRNFEPWLDGLKESLKMAEAEAAAMPQPEGYEFALTLAAMSIYEKAIEELRSLTTRVPNHSGAWRKLAELLRLAGQDEAADEAGAAADRCAGEASKWRPTRDPRTLAQLDAAESRLHALLTTRDQGGKIFMLSDHLRENPTDAVATRILSRLEDQRGDEETSLALLERTLELAPTYHTARGELATRLILAHYFVRALEHTTILLRQAPRNAEYRAIHSEALKCMGDIAAALPVMEELLREHPRHALFWCWYGRLLHLIGRSDDSARAFRSCLEISPTIGGAWFGLADLKCDLLTDKDVSTMRACLTDETLEPGSRMEMYYALGYALERAGDFSASFDAYQQGARLFRGRHLGSGQAHVDDAFVECLRRLKRVYTARNLARFAAPPSASRSVTPIFVVGLPRAGSTLVEQILASHSRVEGTRELPLISEMQRDLALSRRMVTHNAYPDCLLEMTAEQMTALGERYLREARRYRKTERPYFIDKRPWNWLDAGLIRMILPHAKIIDIRREPMAACFAMFKQILPDADFSYDLHNLGRYYTEYVGLMEHWRAAMPGRIHFVQYERLVEDTETEIRRMLDYCGLPFEEDCLRFWENKRAVSTPSAEQVRRPIYRDAVEQWRNYESWLGPLKAALAEPPRA
jgi:predicted Zn-dependent protease